MKIVREQKIDKPKPPQRKQINVPGRDRALLEEVSAILGSSSEWECIGICLRTFKSAYEAGEFDV